MAESNDYYDDEFSLDEEQFPMQRAEAAAMLAEEMRREEEALTGGVPWTPPAAPVSAPGPTMADLRSQYNAAVGERDDTAALAAMRQIEAARGGDPGSILRVQTQVPYEIPSPAQQQYEAQQAFQRDVDIGIAPDVAWNRHGPRIMAGTAGAKPMTAYQQAQVERWKKPPTLTPYQEAQIARWKEQETKKKTPVPTGISMRYRALIAEETAANMADDPGAKNRARWAREEFEKQHPELMGVGTTPAATQQATVAPPTSAGSRVRMRSPEGKVGTIPASQLEDALAAGWKRL